MAQTPIADGIASPFDATEVTDKLHFALFALVHGDTATAELRTRQAAELLASHEKGMAVVVHYVRVGP